MSNLNGRVLDNEKSISEPIPGQLLDREDRVSLKTSVNPYVIPSPFIYEYNLASKIRKELIKIGSPFRNVDVTRFPEEARASILSFAIALDAHYAAYENSEEIEFVLDSVLRSDMASFLKKRKFISFLDSNRCRTFEDDEEFRNIPRTRISSDSGVAFDYKHSLFYNEIVEDYKYGLIEDDSSDRYLKKFRKIAKSLLSEIEFEPIPIEEILMRSGGEKAYKDGNIIPFYKLDKSELNLSNKRKPAKRIVIPAGPGNMRDAILNEPEDLLRILSIDFNLDKLLRENFKKYIDNKDPNIFRKQYKKFVTRNSHFLCRDFKKEGITKPFKIIKILLEELYNSTKCYAFEITDFFDSYQIILEDGSMINLKRGHGLGMGNSLTTLMQIVLFFLVMKREEFSGDTPDMLTHNDDIIIGFKNEEDLLNFWDAEDVVCKELSLLRNPKKSFYGKEGFFLETYTFDGNICQNRFHHSIEAYSTFKCVNISHAKSHVRSLKEIDESLLKEIITKFGYEFFPDEYMFPASLGGWRSHILRNVDLSLIRLNELYFNLDIVRAYIACRDQFTIKNGEGPSSVSHFSKEYDDLIEKDFYKSFCKGNDKYKSFIYARNSLSNAKTRRFWEGVFSWRRRRFNDDFPHLGFRDFCNKYVEESERDVVPLEFQVEEWTNDYIGLVDLPVDHYQGSNPRLNYLSSLSSYKSFFPEKYSLAKNLSNFTPIKNSNWFKDITVCADHDQVTSGYLFPTEKDYERASMFCYDITSYFSVCGEIYNKIPFPIFNGKRINKIGILRKQVYGFYLPYWTAFLPEIKSQFIKKELFSCTEKSFYKALDIIYNKKIDDERKEVDIQQENSEISTDEDDNDDPEKEEVIRISDKQLMSLIQNCLTTISPDHQNKDESEDEENQDPEKSKSMSDNDKESEEELTEEDPHSITPEQLKGIKDSRAAVIRASLSSFDDGGKLNEYVEATRKILEYFGQDWEEFVQEYNIFLEDKDLDGDEPIELFF
jgi:hypothetical protein